MSEERCTSCSLLPPVYCVMKHRALAKLDGDGGARLEVRKAECNHWMIPQLSPLTLYWEQEIAGGLRYHFW